MPCLYRTYNQCEMILGVALENETATKELCLYFLKLSDELYRANNFINYLARAAARHRLALFYADEGDFNMYKRYMIELLSELQQATKQYGHNEDWDEYLNGISKELDDLNE